MNDFAHAQSEALQLKIVNFQAWKTEVIYILEHETLPGLRFHFAAQVNPNFVRDTLK